MTATLVLLPGLSCDAAVWQPVVAALEGVDCRVVEPEDDDDLGAMADAVLARTPQRFVLAGHSMGGRIALEVVRRAPQRVTGLALLDTGFAPLPEGEAGERERAHRYALLAVAREEGMPAMAARWAAPMVHPSRLRDPALMQSILSMISRSSPARFERQLEALLKRPDASDLLRTIRCPALVLCGRQDGWANVEQHRDLAARIPGSRLVIVEDCGHMSPLEQPHAVADALRALLCDQPIPAAAA